MGDERPGRGPGETPDRRPGERLVRAADIVFSATVRAGSVTFEEAPEVAVTFSGEPAHRSGSGSRRTGLPERVAEGETYRAIRVDYAIAAKIVTEAPEEGEEEP
ncbi:MULTISPECIES: hypothetical protein [unclassified Nonomuraea]|uniref:hypothetical protein n=1 Tax=unclassified Nonomuraea TaxID=2593643 RepID=UPI00191C00EC|nr:MULTISPECIES: hypothetical protein [unclassified Nonomuraea]